MRLLLSKLRRAGEVVLRGSVFESGLYRESELTRLVNLFAHVDLERWRGLRVLEVGAGHGRLGDAFVELGFDVTSTDGRPENVEHMKARGRQAFVLDLDAEDAAYGDYDLILAFGVLYHLARPERFLRACAERAQVLLLETCVTDAAEPVLYQVRERRGWGSEDQALLGHGSRPSPAWVEKICREAGFESMRDISSPLANWSTTCFDWEPRNDGRWHRDGSNLRRMWVLEKAS